MEDGTQMDDDPKSEAGKRPITNLGLHLRDLRHTGNT